MRDNTSRDFIFASLQIFSKCEWWCCTQTEPCLRFQILDGVSRIETQFPQRCTEQSSRNLQVLLNLWVLSRTRRVSERERLIWVTMPSLPSFRGQHWTPPPTLLSGKLIFSCNSAWIPPHTKNKKERNLLLQFSWNITNLKCWCQPSQMGYVANGCGFDADDKRPCLFEDTWKHCITLDPAQWLFVEAVFRQGGTIHKFIQAQK